MNYKASSPLEYLEQLPPERQEAMSKLRDTINENIADGFTEAMSYGMIGWVVPLSTYPNGYHCKKEEPLPFLSIASQKNFIGVYHMGIYANPELHDWFISEYPKHVKTKLDMGKSCIRLKKMEQIPYELIAELVGKMSLDQWVDIYEASMKR